MTTVLLDFQLYQKCRDDIKLDAPSNPILPKGSKLLSIQPAKTSSDEGGGDQSLPPPIVLGKTADKNEDHCEQLVQTWGSPWSPLEFVKQAVKAGHPSRLDACLPMRLKLFSQKFRVVPLLECCRHRIQKTKFWMDRMAVLKSQEKILKASMHKDVRLVLADKNILLWKEMLQSTNYEDMGVVEEFTSGTALVGSAPITGLWPAKFTPVTMSISELHDTARRERLHGVRAIPMDPAMVEMVWEQTLAEVQSGFLIGPIEFYQVPHHIPLGKRFGIKQGAKTRCLDDFSRSGINSCAQVSESPKPHTVDIIASLGLSLMRHSPAGALWKVRTYDLSCAYRQCAVHPDSLQFSYILVAVPGEDRSVAFQMKALPFGSVRSVNAFLRVAHSLWAIATSEFWVPWTNYFDDFVTFSDSNEQVSVDASIRFLLKSLGWRFAESGDKAPPFGEFVNALGVSIDVSSMGGGKILIDNTANRKLEISSVISSVIDGGRLHRADALRLRGRLQFASGQLFGRLAKKALSIVTEHACSSKNATLDVETVSALKLYLSCLESQRPRAVHRSLSQVFLIFTDACFEPDSLSVKAGIGAVLVDSYGKVTHFFAANLKDDLVNDINKSQRKTIIFELELFAILCAVIGWKQFITNCSVVVYTDNDAVRDCLISCNT